jgi:hypothetical protein
MSITRALSVIYIRMIDKFGTYTIGIIIKLNTIFVPFYTILVITATLS